MSDQDPPRDPFSAYESDRTIIKPSGGVGRRPATPGPAPAGGPAAAPPARPDAPDEALASLPRLAALNPLVQAAAPLLAAAPRLRAMARHPDPAGLRAALGEAIGRFDTSARQQGLPNEQVVAARYVLCTLLDEAASSTPWGSSGAWASRSLLVQYHNESWGGEKVFQLLQRLAETPAQHRDLLELIYLSLALGFEGRYRVQDQGRAQLDALRQRLAEILRQQAGPAPTELSGHWRGQAGPARRLRDGIPVWVVACGAALLLMLVFAGLRLSLNVQTDGTFNALQALGVRPAVAATPAPAPAAPTPPRLAQLLREDIARGAVQVTDLPDRSVVTVLGDSLFDPGSADVAPRALPLFQHIAAALNQVPGQVLVAGYTDNRPIRSLRFPSNWHLSKERASSVQRLLDTSVKPERLRAEGRADSDPVADNATPDGRAKNRRVEITLFPANPS